MKRLSLGLVFLLGCTGDDVKSGAVAPADAGVDAGPTACTEPPRCEGDELVTCGARQACALGCDAQSMRCKTIAPSGAAGAVDVSIATADTTLSEVNVYWFDTQTGSIGFRDDTGTPAGVPLRAGGPGIVSGIGFASVPQDGGPKLGVFFFRSLTVATGATVKVYGPDPIALVALGDLTVAGTVTVSADCAKNAPGPGAPVDGPTKGLTNTVTNNTNPGYKGICGGAGGGANATAGGKGGDGNGNNGSTTTPQQAQAPGGSGGLARAKTLIDQPLFVGGGPGGGGSRWPVPTPNDPVFPGGAGGGALQLAAGGTLLVSGLVDAAGCGGRRGWSGANLPVGSADCWGAGGGGAGGTIALEGGVVRIAPTGRVLANGGGGGGGCTWSNSNAMPNTNEDGASNSTNAERAKGGKADGRRTNADACGPGQDGNVPKDEFFQASCYVPTNIPVAASGGGGGMGLIGVRTRDATYITEDGGIVNPAPARSIASVK